MQPAKKCWLLVVSASQAPLTLFHEYTCIHSGFQKCTNEGTHLNTALVCHAGVPVSSCCICWSRCFKTATDICTNKQGNKTGFILTGENVHVYCCFTEKLRG